VEPFTSAAGRAEALLELLGIEFGFGIGLARSIHGSIGEAEQNPPNHAQYQSRVRSSYTAQVFSHSHIQTMVQPTFNNPVAAFEPEQTLRLQLFHR